MDIKRDFPILFNNEKLHYLDTAATSQKPKEIIDEIVNYYNLDNGNPGRGSHELSMKNKAIVDFNRKKIAEFVGADKEEIVFTKNTTEALNIIAFSYAMENLERGDEILIGISNHHSNIVPWQIISEKKGIRLRYIYLDENGNLDIEKMKKIISNKTKLVSISLVVNSTGVIQDYEKVIEISHKYGAKVILDCAQSIMHFKHEFNNWNVDFAAFSGHKIFASQGIGILYAKKELLDIMSPFIYGGDMVEYVNEKSSTFKKGVSKFEGGTLNVEGILTLGKAIEYIEKIGYENIYKIEEELLRYALFSLTCLDFVELYFVNDTNRVAVIAFNVKGVHSHDVSFVLDSYNVAIRSGQHCCAPLMKYMGINSCCRMSLAIYNDKEDIDALINGLMKVKEIFLSDI